MHSVNQRTLNQVICKNNTVILIINDSAAPSRLFSLLRFLVQRWIANVLIRWRFLARLWSAVNTRFCALSCTTQVARCVFAVRFTYFERWGLFSQTPPPGSFGCSYRRPEFEILKRYERKSISKLLVVIEKKRMEIMTFKQHLFFNVMSIQI